MSSLPHVYPKTRKYAPGEFQTKRFQSVSGAGVTRLYGNKPFDATLDLTFQVDDDVVKQFFDCWYSAFGDYKSIDLPDEYFVGMRKDLWPCHLEWRWSKQPDVKTDQRNLSTVTASFVGVLEIQ